MDKKRVFEDFNKRVNEIILHYDEIDNLKFNASLKNGTKFSFNYDINQFEKVKSIRELNSVRNGIQDIITGLISIFLFVFSLYKYNTYTLTNTLTYSIFILFSTLSSIYHLFSINHKRTGRTLLLVRQLFLMVFICSLSLALVNDSFYELIFVVLSFIALFLFLQSTKGSYRAGNIVIIVIAIALALLKLSNIYNLFISLSIIINALINITFSYKDDQFKDARTNNIFYFAALFFYFLLSSIS